MAFHAPARPFFGMRKIRPPVQQSRFNQNAAWLRADRKITVYNFSCDRFDEKSWLVHYVTKSTVGMLYFRTSLWVKEGSALKMYYHQASPLSEPVELIETP